MRILVAGLLAGAVLVPSSYAVADVCSTWRTEGFADLRGTLWRPGQAVRAGVKPYPNPEPLANLAGSPSVYPPPLILVGGVPLSLLPLWLAGAVWAVVLVGALVATLLLLRVRDPRCYALSLLSAPFVGVIIGGNATPLVVLLVAVAWRYRDRRWLPGLALAGALALKPFVAPLLVWLVATRRWRGALAAVGGALGLALLGWAVIGFRGLRDYPHLLANLSGVAGPHGASVYALARDLGASHPAAEAASAVLAAAVLLYGRGSFSSAIVASLLATPVIWAHYFLLLFVVAAAASVTLSPLWVLPLAVGPAAFSVGATRPLWVTLLGVLAALAASSGRSPEFRRRSIT
jgi:alpha-1,2-mannosyltransferase